MEEPLSVDGGNTVSHILCPVSAVRKDRRKEKRKCASGLSNPIGIQFVWQSALPGAAHSGLLWLRYYIPRETVPERRFDGIERNYAWIIVAVGLSLVFILVLGRGIPLHQ